jgi:hypothetical protein
MAGVDLITWTLERSGILADGGNGFYYQTIDPAISREGDLMRVIDVLAQGAIPRARVGRHGVHARESRGALARSTTRGAKPIQI